MPIAPPLKPQRVQRLTRDYQGINGAFQLFLPEVTDALSHSAGQSWMAPNGTLQKAPAFF